MDMHELLLKGVDEKELRRELKTKITKGKIKVVSDLDSTQKALYLSENERKRQEAAKNLAIKTLREKYLTEFSLDYDRETKKIIRKYRKEKPLLFLFVSVILFLLLYNTNAVDAFWSVIIGLLVNAIYNWYCNIKKLKRIISERNRNKQKYVHDKANMEINAKMGSF